MIFNVKRNDKMRERRIINKLNPQKFLRYDEEKNELYEVISGRIAKILKVAADNNHKNILLGMFGCGAFGNSPEMVANIFKEQLKIHSYFDHIVFPAFDTHEHTPKYNIFQEALCENNK